MNAERFQDQHHLAETKMNGRGRLMSTKIRTCKATSGSCGFFEKSDSAMISFDHVNDNVRRRVQGALAFAGKKT